MSIYDRINQRRKDIGVSKAFIGLKLGYGRTWLNSAELNNTILKDDTIDRLSDILFTTREYLTGETDNPSISIKKKLNLTEEELDRELIEMLSRLTPEQEQLVRAFVAGIKATRKDGPSHRPKGQK